MVLLRMMLGSMVLTALFLAPRADADEKKIFEAPSTFNNKILVTEDDDGNRVLRFEQGGDRQSVVKLGDPDHLELPYARLIPLGIAIVDRPERVLVVGLGGGTIPMFLRKHMPSLAIDAVDIDPAVVAVAKSHFGFREDAKMRAHIDDGRHFIEQRSAHYDIIFLDAFGSDNIPYSLATREFLVSVKRALTPGGVVIGNVWGARANPLYHSMVRTYQAVYDEVTVINVRDALNKILIACPKKRGLTVDVLASKSRTLTNALSLRVDLAELVRTGYRVDATDGAGGRVLLDADRPK